MSEPKLKASEAMRAIIDEQLSAGATEITFSAGDLLEKAANMSADEHERKNGIVVSQEDRERNIEMYEIHFSSEANKKMLTSYSANVIKRHLGKIGKSCSVTSGQGELWNEVHITVFDADEPQDEIKPAKRRSAKGKINPAQIESGEHVDTVKVRAFSSWSPNVMNYDDSEVATIRKVIAEFNEFASSLNGKSTESDE